MTVLKTTLKIAVRLAAFCVFIPVVAIAVYLAVVGSMIGSVIWIIGCGLVSFAKFLGDDEVWAGAMKRAEEKSEARLREIGSESRDRI